MATVVRMVHDPTARAYAERRKAEGKTPREILRCLKRYLARRLTSAALQIEDSDHEGLGAEIMPGPIGQHTLIVQQDPGYEKR